LYTAFAGFAAATWLFSGQPVQRAWGLWAAAGYTAAALAAVSWRSRGRDAALVIALAGALIAPVAWMLTGGRGMSTVGEGSLTVVARSGALLAHHGSPYLPPAQLSHVLAYDPYEPLMAVFGLPGAAGLPGLAGSPRLWFGITAAVVLYLALRIAHGGGALRYTAFALGSPLVALPLTVSGTDVPVIALLCLAFACLGGGPSPRGQPAPGRGPAMPSPPVAAGLAIGVACAMKATAWPALPVIAALVTARDGRGPAGRFTAAAVGTAAAAAAAAAPAALARPVALLVNTVAFPLGFTRQQTPAASPLPGHLLAMSGRAGHGAAIALLAAACVAMAALLIVWPPRTVRAAAVWLAAAMTVIFLLAPASRWGYFAYPAGLCGWLWLSAPDGPECREGSRDERARDLSARE
jgi:phosphatidylinositol alpha-1,6-mannosyltransferase